MYIQVGRGVAVVRKQACFCEYLMNVCITVCTSVYVSATVYTDGC